MIKHSKYKNTGILFELLVRQATSDLMSKKDPQAVKILNGEDIFDEYLGLIGPGSDFYEAARQQLAREVQALALQGYAK
jgi:hypothetical protein